MKIVTFNIRIEHTTKAERINDFVHRAGGILMKIDKEDPDILCFQEVTPGIGDFLLRHLPDYTLLGHEREADDSAGYNPIAIKKGMFDVLYRRIFWLSDTPEVPGSRLPEAQARGPRVCTALQLRRRADHKVFSVYNTHLDFVSPEVTLGMMSVVLKQLQTDQKAEAMPFFVTGDMNAPPENPAIAYANAFADPVLVDITRHIPVTNHDFGAPLEAQSKLDYIFTDEETAKTVTEVTIWDDCHAGIYLSDHYPVSAQLQF